MQILTEKQLTSLNKLGVIVARLTSHVGTPDDLKSVIKYHLLCAAIDALGSVVGLTQELDSIHKTLTKLSKDGVLYVPHDDITQLWRLSDVYRFQLPNITDADFERALKLAKVNL